MVELCHKLNEFGRSLSLSLSFLMSRMGAIILFLGPARLGAHEVPRLGSARHQGFKLPSGWSKPGLARTSPDAHAPASRCGIFLAVFLQGLDLLLLGFTLPGPGTCHFSKGSLHGANPGQTPSQLPCTGSQAGALCPAVPSPATQPPHSDLSRRHLRSTPLWLGLQ